MDFKKFETVFFGKKINAFLILPIFFFSVMVIIYTFTNLGTPFVFVNFMMAAVPPVIYAKADDFLDFFKVKKSKVRRVSLILSMTVLGLYFLIFSWNLMDNIIMILVYYGYIRVMHEIFSPK